MKLNKGEWSEPYCLLKSMETGGLFLCDSNLIPTGKTIDVIGGQLSNEVNFSISEDTIKFNNGKQYNVSTIKPLVSTILEHLQNKQNRTFEISEIINFYNDIGNPSLKAKSSDKPDCTLSVYDDMTKTEETLNFSIKSFLSGSPSIVNASGSTNFIYHVDIDDINEFENIKTKKLLFKLDESDININFLNAQSSTYNNNLMLIDTQMPMIISEMLKIYFSGKLRNIKDLVEVLKRKNPLNINNTNLYENKISDFLFYSATGMFPSKEWIGIQDVDGGCMLVKKNGDIATFYIYRKSSLQHFRNYLYDKCFLDTPSTTRHKFGYLYKENELTKLKLNLQVRIKY